jgi:transglutaminase-like putative cysteine protease
LTTTLGSNPEPERTDPDFWDTKHPEAPVVYAGRPCPGRTFHFDVDVRRFIWADDVVLSRFIQSGDPWMKRARDLSDPDAIAQFVQQWAVSGIVYTSDKTLVDTWTEFWLFPGETLVRHQGDCEDGAILIASLCLNLGIPADRIRVAAGTVRAGAGAATGGHAWATYRRTTDDEWIALDWCYYEDADTRVQDKVRLKDRDEYFGGDRVWFSFNHLKAWSHERSVTIGGRVYNPADWKGRP